LLSIEGAFTSAASEGLIRSILAAGEATGHALFEAVARSDQSAGEAVSALLVDTLDHAEAVARFPETHGRVMEFALKQELVRVQADMRAKDSAGDSAASDELFRRARDVQRRLDELRASRQTGR